MFPILYEQITAGVIPQNNGIGILSDASDGYCEHAANDIYEVSFKYPITGIHASELAYRRVIKIKPNPTDDPQLFRIDRIGKVMNGKFTVYCKHISYDLSGYDITSGTASSASGACVLLQNSASGWTITTDKTVSASFKILEPSSVKSWFVGKEGSFLDVFGTADIIYNNFSVNFKLHGGEDRGVTLRYGKNLLELSQEITDTLYTHVRCYYKDQDNVVTGDKVSTGLTLDVPKCLIVDCSQDYDSPPTVSDLTSKATAYKNSHNLTIPSNNIKLDFVQSGELKDRVDLFDTVSVYYPALGITRTQMKCIRTKYDFIKEKYVEVECGDAKNTLTDTLAINNKELANKPSTSFMEDAVKHATQLITGNLGGYVILHDSNGDGEPDEILIMDTADITTCQKIWRWNKNGLGYSSTGYSGTYGTAITNDGKIVADYILTGVLNANLIKAGVISDSGNNSSIDMTSGIATLKNMKAKQSFELIDSNNVKRGFFQYIEGSGEPHLGVVSASNEALAEIWGDSVGGKLRLQKPNGNDMAFLSSNNDGGSLTLYNDSNNARVSMWVDNYDHGDIYLYNESGDAKIKMYGSGEIVCVSLTQTSSRKVKDNIKPIEDSEKLLELQAVSFDYKEKEQGTNRRGFIAEDVAEVLPNLVSEGETPSLNYIEMIPYLQDIIKKQEARITELEKKIEKLYNDRKEK